MMSHSSILYEEYYHLINILSYNSLSPTAKFETFVNICLRMTTCILKPIRDVQYLPTIVDLDAFHISCCCAIFAYGMITCLDIACRAYSFVE